LHVHVCVCVREGVSQSTLGMRVYAQPIANAVLATRTLNTNIKATHTMHSLKAVNAIPTYPHASRRDYFTSTQFFQSRVCVCTQRTGAATRESLQRDRPGGLTSHALHLTAAPAFSCTLFCHLN
jgi:hypothetical protein